MSIFQAADILLPQTEKIEKWAVIACDQFTSQQDYWQEVETKVGDDPSTLRLILPECYLTPGYEKRIPVINSKMAAYLEKGLLKEYKDSYVYVERTLQNGAVRRGLVGALDLEAYDYARDAHCAIRATEQTVIERIPPRVAIRENALLELPHIIIFCDDAEDELFGTCSKLKEGCPKLYDFELMCGGGHIAGWLLAGEAKAVVDACFAQYEASCRAKYAGQNPVVLAVGDGNHSLATAKACYEKLKVKNPQLDLAKHPARYALVEIENIQDEAQEFEPIHRVITGCEPQKLLARMQESICAKEGFPVEWFAGTEQGTLYIDPAKGKLAVKTVQDFLDAYLAENAGEIDYIHGADTTAALAEADGALGLILPPFAKEALFDSIQAQGALPRKTFSIGHAVEKRYYLEARRIK